LTRDVPRLGGGASRRIERVTVEINIAFIETEYYGISNTFPAGGPDFDEKYDTLMSKMVKALSQAARSTDLELRLRDFKTRLPLDICVLDSGNRARPKHLPHQLPMGGASAQAKGRS